MKKTILKGLLFFGLVALLFSCEKENAEMDTTADSSIDLITILENEEYRSQFMEKLESVLPPNQRGAEKITPLISNFGMILLNRDEGGNAEELALFSIALGPNDTWTELPDGSINIHLNNDEASSLYYNYQTQASYCGQNGNLSMNYNGIYTELEFCGPWGCFIFKYVDTSQTTHAFNFFGRADVGVSEGPVCGTPDSNLMAKFVRTNGGQANGFIKLH